MMPLTMRRIRPFALLFAVATVLVVAGCGSSSNSSSSSSTSKAAAAASTITGPSVTDTTGTYPVNPALTKKPVIKLPTGPAPKKLVIKDLVPGTGRKVVSGDPLVVRYVGELYKNGKQFDASWDRKPNTFPVSIGLGQVIPGWDKGLIGMRVGGRRELIIPPSLGYGAAGSPPSIPANAPLVFVIDLLADRSAD